MPPDEQHVRTGCQLSSPTQTLPPCPTLPANTRSGVYNDLGSGSNVDVCVITKDKVDYMRNYEYLQDKTYARQQPKRFATGSVRKCHRRLPSQAAPHCASYSAAAPSPLGACCAQRRCWPCCCCTRAQRPSPPLL